MCIMPQVLFSFCFLPRGFKIWLTDSFFMHKSSLLEKYCGKIECCNHKISIYTMAIISFQNHKGTMYNV